MSKHPIIDSPGGGRSVREWIGKTLDSMPPPSVRLRIFHRHGGKCFLTGREIRPGDVWECHHVKGLLEGGENRESNLAPVLRDAHKVETARQRKQKASADAKRIIHIGADAPSPNPIKSRGFTKVVRDKEKIEKSPIKQTGSFAGCYRLKEIEP